VSIQESSAVQQPGLVEILVANSIRAGASVEQVAQATKRPPREIQQMLENVQLLEAAVSRELAEAGRCPRSSTDQNTVRTESNEKSFR
jgi:hypothetical protein